MANIIEKEIEKRKEIIAAKEEKQAKLEELQKEIVVLAEEIAATNTDTLLAEIAELESFIKVEEVSNEEVVQEPVEQVVAE